MNEKKSDLDEDTMVQVKANVLLMKANQAYEAGDYHQATDILKQTLSLVPGNASVWFELARNYREAGMIEEEITCYKKIIDELGEDAAWMDMALAYRIMGKHAEELYCLIMVADKGTDFFQDSDTKHVFIDRYRELVHQKVRARSPLSDEDKVPIFDGRALGNKEIPEHANCFVCFQKIDNQKEQGSILMCPHCNRVAHFVCLASWLQANNACPVCQGMLDFSLEDYDMRKVLGIQQDRD